LWLTLADIEVHQGGFNLAISEPLNEPMSIFRVQTAMGGFEVEGLGNASPQKLDINCRMGGAQVNLDGAWQNDCDLELAGKMGGMGVIVPRDVEVQHGLDEGLTLDESVPEVAKPVMRIHTSEQYGEIDIIH